MTEDPFDFLVDRNEIAHIYGVGPTAVSNYVARTSDKHPEFPEPVIVRAKGRFRLWNLSDVTAWHTQTFPKRGVTFNEADERLAKYRASQS
jgi:predicted DNA-binding transcriptional regulator AlpA